MSSVDLALRYLIIAVAWHLACAWVQTFQSPYPIADAFELAGTAEEQLFKSLGISWRSLGAAASKVILLPVLAESSRSSGAKYLPPNSCRFPSVVSPHVWLQASRVPSISISAV